MIIITWKADIRKEKKQLFKVTIEALADMNIVYENSELYSTDFAKGLIAVIDKYISEQTKTTPNAVDDTNFGEPNRAEDWHLDNMGE